MWVKILRERGRERERDPYNIPVPVDKGITKTLEVRNWLRSGFEIWYPFSSHTPGYKVLEKKTCQLPWNHHHQAQIRLIYGPELAVKEDDFLMMDPFAKSISKQWRLIKWRSNKWSNAGQRSIIMLQINYKHLWFANLIVWHCQRFFFLFWFIMFSCLETNNSVINRLMENAVL